MINKQHFAALLCLLVSGFVPALTPLLAQQPRSPFNDPSLPMEKRIDNLLSLMTVDEKIDCLSTNTGVPRLGVMSYGSSEASTAWSSGKPEARAWWDEKLLGFRVEAEPIRVMIGNSSADIQLTTEVRVQ